MSVFDDDVPRFRRIDGGWGLGSSADEFLAYLAGTPSFGGTDEARVASFMKLPQAAEQPRAIRSELRLRGLLPQA